MHNNPSKLYCISDNMQHMTKISNLSDVIPTMESIPCHDCGNHVTMSPHPNSHLIAGMDDCLYHAQCRNIACENYSKKKKTFFISIACQAANNNRSVNSSTTGVTKGIKTATKHKITTAYEFNEVLEKIINPGTTTTIHKRFVIS